VSLPVFLVLALTLIGASARANVLPRKTQDRPDAAVTYALIVGNVFATAFCVQAIARSGSLVWGAVAIGVGAASIATDEEGDWDVLGAVGIITAGMGTFSILRVIQTSGPIESAVDLSPHYSRMGGWGAEVRVSF
jgi:hypothetical protein